MARPPRLPPPFPPATEFDDAPPTVDDAAPLPDPAREITRKVKTLHGYARGIEGEIEIARARGRARGRQEVLTGFRLAMMASGTPPEVAQEQADRLHRWMLVPENAELVRVALDEDDTA